MKKNNNNYSPARSIAATAGRAAAETFIHEGGKVIREHVKYIYWEKRQHSLDKNINELIDELNDKLNCIEFSKDGPHEDPAADSNYIPKEESLNDVAEKEIEAITDIVKDLLVLGGVCVIFGLPGHGKSTLLMQILIDIASGQDSLVFPGCEYRERPKVVVYDAELRDSQIKNRYCSYGFSFPNNLIRISDSKVVCAGSKVISDISRIVKNSESSLVIAIDNMTKIFNSMKAEEVNVFYKQLDEIHEQAEKRGQSITFFIVGHTIKTEAHSAPELSDVYGSSFISNFANTVIALWPSNRGNNIKFLRVLKNRDHEFSETEVKLVERVKEPYLHFNLVKDKVPLNDALKAKPKAQRSSSGNEPKDAQSTEDKVRDIIEVYNSEENKQTIDALCKSKGITRKTYYEYVKKLRL